MIRFLLLTVFLILFTGTYAQVNSDSIINSRSDSILVDSIPGVDTISPTIALDSFSKMPPKEFKWDWNPQTPVNSINLLWEAMKRNPFFGFASSASVFNIETRKVAGKEWLFYLIIVILLGYAFLKKAFPKYFVDLFRLFFRTTLKQRQIKEQLMQTPLPSLLLNGFYVVTAGLYISFILLHYQLEVPGGFWMSYLYSCLGLTLIYFVKFVGLKITGWLFNMNEAAGNYIFIVFVVNKMIAILLLPVLILLAFSSTPIYDVALTGSYCLVAGLFGYRIILTFAAIRNQVKVNPFHFFLYLLAFEVAPLLILYKGLLLFFGITA